MKIEGFSKLSKIEKIKLISNTLFNNNLLLTDKLKTFWHSDNKTQKLFDEFSENTISNFHLPFGVVPNVKINNKIYIVPMVIEESSVVAACSRSGKYWFDRGGFKAKVINNEKIGHVHFDWTGDFDEIQTLFADNIDKLYLEIESLQSSMKKRGGGIKDIRFKNLTNLEPGFGQIEITFDTCDAMGANFVNSILEAVGHKFKRIVDRKLIGIGELEIIMCILSNYTPDCLVRASVSCPISELDDNSLGMTPEVFANKIYKAVRISKIDKYRATTHNKGIFNGIDAVVLATGNDFRAIEACGHTYASRDGSYQGLTDCKIEEGIFTLTLEIPLSVGTVGGLTSLHPLAEFSLDLLQRPSANDLMQIIATIGLAQNFAALKSLVTSGIQKGHMKMHLMNILNHLEANESEREQTKIEFSTKAVSYSSVREYLGTLRNYQ